jgi:hypothetical protein
MRNLTETTFQSARFRSLLPFFGALLPTLANGAVTPSIADASTFPITPNFQTFAPGTTPTGAERTVLTLAAGAGDPRILTQTFRLSSGLTLGSIHLLYGRGVSGELFRVQIFPVANTLAAQGATAGVLSDYNNAVTNGFLLDATVTMPTTSNDNTERLLTLTLTGADAITLPATTGNAGYGIAFSPVKDGTNTADEVFTWRMVQSGTTGPYPNGRLYYDAPGGAAGAANRDGSLALVELVLDTDSDGMPDNWEIANGTDPNLNDALLDNDANGGSDDLTNFEEFQNHTHPNDSDTDDDGLEDGTEVKALHPSGFDSNPLLADGDADGAPDLAEHTGSLNTQFGNAKTDPMVADSDTDGMSDGYELTCNNPGTALDPNDNGSIDPTQAPAGHRDSDTLTNIEEYTPTLGPNTASPRTRADLADTDDDGYNDNQEDNLGSWGGINFTGTNPIDPDTDNDGIDDGDENPETGTAGSAPYNSNPTSADSDGDSFTDHYEVTHSTDPANASSTPAQPAGFTLVENFEGAGMTIGQTFNGVNEWATTVPTGAVVADEPIAGGDKVGAMIRVAGSSFAASKPLTTSGLQVLEGNTGTIFLQLNCSTAAQDNSFGLSDEAAPTGFGGYETQLVTFSNGSLRLCDTGAVFRDTLPYPVGAWMNVWIVADNATDTYRVYVESPQGQTGQVEITANDGGDAFNFRNGTTGALTSFLTMVATPASAGSSVFIDNIYVDPTKANLTTPAAAKPLPPLPFQVTAVFFEGGDLKIKFSPGGAGYIVTSSNDLGSPFLHETNAVFDGVDTFTVPAASLNAGHDFFRVEESP